MFQADFNIKTPIFEGPLDLLLDLIERRKLHISDISLAKITDDYIAYLEQLQEFPLRSAAHFILVASTLLLIKSRALLPSLPLTEEEEGNIAELERRLKEYKRIKELSLHIKERFGAHVIFFREPPKDIVPVFSPTKEITLQTILQSIKTIIGNLPTIEMIPQIVVKKIITLEEMVDRLSNRITNALNLSFSEFTASHAPDKNHVIVSFLALLELIRRGIIAVRQEKHFDEIIMETNTVKIPRYE